ncbi:hypothetical protein BH23GEM3_BH23GEM3_10150 [soil metagenome]
MTGPSPAQIAEPVRREIELAAAVARECLLDTHFAYVMEFVEHARADIAAPRVLSIYMRLHSVSPTDAATLTHRVFVALGRRVVEAESAERMAAANQNADALWDSPNSVFHRIHRRLRGRTNQELRRWVELHTGRTEVALLEVHVKNALRVIRILDPESSYAGAVQLYGELLSLSAPRVETIYYLALNGLCNPVPGAPVRAVAALKSGTAPAAAPDIPALRILENRG